MTAREKLPMRRDGTSITFQFPAWHGPSYNVHYSRFADGRAAELFLSLYGKGTSGSSLEAMARDSAILASLALQYGAPLATLIEAMTAETDGTATSVIGCALQLVQDALKDTPPDAVPDVPAPAGPPSGPSQGSPSNAAADALAASGAAA